MTDRRILALIPVAAAAGLAAASLDWVLALLVPGAIGFWVIVVTTPRICSGADAELRSRVFRWGLGSFGLHLAVGAAITASPALVLAINGDAIGYHRTA